MFFIFNKLLFISGKGICFVVIVICWKYKGKNGYLFFDCVLILLGGIRVCNRFVKSKMILFLRKFRRFC